MHDYLKANDLLVVPIDKGRVFCVIKKSMCREKYDDVLNSDQFQKINGAKHKIVLKNEKLAQSRQQLIKQDKINYNIYEILRSTVSQPAQFYGLAKKLEQISDTNLPEAIRRKR